MKSIIIFTHLKSVAISKLAFLQILSKSTILTQDVPDMTLRIVLSSRCKRRTDLWYFLFMHNLIEVTHSSLKKRQPEFPSVEVPPWELDCWTISKAIPVFCKNMSKTFFPLMDEILKSCFTLRPYQVFLIQMI